MRILNGILNLIERLPILGPAINRLAQAVLRFLLRVPVVRKWVNQKAVNYIASCTDARPRPYSLWSPGGDPLYAIGYTSWPSLTDKTFSGRHLGPADISWTAALPHESSFNYISQTIGSATALFRRQGAIRTDRSSLLFMFFAQWFTDSILRTDPNDRRKNTSRHDVNLCQIYGLDEDKTLLLRSLKDGRLRSQSINGEECLDYLCESDGIGGWKVKMHYESLGYADKLDSLVDHPERREKLYATGLERGNSTIGYVAISTLFMREHNRICGELKLNYPEWDDEQYFQTARMINIILLLKLVVEEYINHIAGIKLFRLDVGFAENEKWYRTNWIALEFNLLYRWHGLVPDVIQIKGISCKADDFRSNNALFEKVGLGALIESASSQAAGKIGLSNTPDFLLGAEYLSIKMGRDYRLRSYNDYRERFGYNRLRDFNELTSDATLQQSLKDLYGDIDKVEYVVGLFAEESPKGALFGNLLNRMVAYDAFTQIYTNPLLSKNVFNSNMLTNYGMILIETTRSLQDLVDRNVKHVRKDSVSLGVDLKK